MQINMSLDDCLAKQCGYQTVLGILLVACTVLSLGGCGGAGTSASDMRRYAIRRKSDPEVTTPDPPTPRRNEEPKVAETVRVESKDTVKTSDSIEPPVEPADEPAKVSSEPLSDTKPPPEVPLNPEECAKADVANMQRIAEALDQHVKNKGYFPARAIFSREHEPLLSWRVALLPYLGYERLYASFHLDEPWNSRHNHELLENIPSVYQSPRRFDDHTNYEVPVATNTAFGVNRVVPLSRFEDGPANTVVVVEVDELAAVPWTAPQEYEVDSTAPSKNLGSLRGDDSFFVVWGDRQVGRILTTSSAQDLRAMFTHESGEDFTAGRIDQALILPQSSAESIEASQATGTSRSASEEVNSPASGVKAELASLSKEYFEKSQQLSALGNERAAMDYFYASAVTAPSGGDWVKHYHWIPALHRPTPIVRFGIGLQYVGPRESELDATRGVSADHPDRSGRVWPTLTGDFGERIVDVIKNHMKTFGEDSLLPYVTAAGKNQITDQGNSLSGDDQSRSLAPGISFLAVGRDAMIRKLARREEVDVLLLVDWRESQHGWSGGLKMFDVVRDVELWKMSRVQNQVVEEIPVDSQAFDPLVKATDDFALFLESQFSLRELPTTLAPRHALGRLNMLAETNHENPLPSLAEMKFYNQLGYVNDLDLLRAVQAKIGEEDGAQLLLGSAESRREILRNWLPLVEAMDDRHSLSKANTSIHRDD